MARGSQVLLGCTSTWNMSTRKMLFAFDFYSKNIKEFELNGLHAIGFAFFRFDNATICFIIIFRSYQCSAEFILELSMRDVSEGFLVSHSQYQRPRLIYTRIGITQVSYPLLTRENGTLDSIHVLLGCVSLVPASFDLSIKGYRVYNHNDYLLNFFALP